MVLEISVRNIEKDESLKVKVDPEEKIADTIDKLNSYWDMDTNTKLLLGEKRLNDDAFWADTRVEDGNTLALLPKDGERKLPLELWRGRIKNELKRMEGEGHLFEYEEGEESYDLRFYLKDTPAPVLIDGSVGLVFEHEFTVSIDRRYPYEPPSVKWRSNIFHPNIAPRGEGGAVRSSYLNDWNFSKDLSTLIKELKGILNSPELDIRLDTDTCRKAAERYKKGGFPSIY